MITTLLLLSPSLLYFPSAEISCDAMLRTAGTDQRTEELGFITQSQTIQYTMFALRSMTRKIPAVSACEQSILCLTSVC